MKFLRLLLLPLLSIFLVAENQSLEKSVNRYIGETSIEKCSEKTAENVSKLTKQGGTAAKIKLNPSQQKAINGLRKQIDKQKKKLADYIKNPDACDNKGFLKNKSPVERERLIRERIDSLEHQILTFEENIDKIEAGTHKVLEKQK